MNIGLTYLNRAFYGLSIDMSHDIKTFFFNIWLVTPPWGSSIPPPYSPILVENMKIKVTNNVHVENRHYISFSVDMPK